MAGWKKLLLGSVVIGLGFLFAVILLVKVYVTPERVHLLVTSGLEKSLQRKVTLGAVDIGLLSGIRLTELSIQTKDDKDLLLTADNLELSYELFRLLRGELYFGKILVKNPQLRLIREIDGRLNIADLFTGPPPAGDPVHPAAVAPKDESFSAMPMLVKQFVLQGGTLQFIDRKLNQQSPYRYRLEQLDVRVEDFSLTQPFAVRLAANLNDSPLALELLYDVVEGLQSLQVHGRQLNLVPFLPYFQDIVPGSLGQGWISTELQISKQATGFAAKGQVVVDRLDIRLNLDPPVRWKGVRIALDQDLVYRPADQVVEVKKLLADVDGVQAGYQGKVLLADPLQLAGEGSLNVVDLRNLSALVPLELREQVTAYAVAGSLAATMQIQGSPVGLEVMPQATIKLTGLQASIGGLRPALTGTFNYSQNRIQGDGLQVDLNGQPLAIDLEATIHKSALPKLQLMVSGENLNLDALMPKQEYAGAAPETKADSESAKGVKAASGTVVGTQTKANPEQKELFGLPFSGRAKVRFAQLLYRGLPFNKVEGQAALHDGTLSLESLTAGLAGGSARLVGAADLSQLQIPMQGRMAVDGIDLAVVANALLPEAQGGISGTLKADTDFSAHGGADDITLALDARGNFDLKDGEIKGSPLLVELSEFLINPELKVLGFSRFSGNYALKSRKGTIDAQLASRRVLILPQGSFSLDGPLNISLPTRISPELLAKSGIKAKGVPLLKDEKGWSMLPLKVKGGYSKPRLILDSTAVKDQLKKGVVNELGRQLQKKLEGSDADQTNQQMQKLLDGTLQKLFGK